MAFLRQVYPIRRRQNGSTLRRVEGVTKVNPDGWSHVYFGMSKTCSPHLTRYLNSFSLNVQNGALRTAFGRCKNDQDSLWTTPFKHHLISTSGLLPYGGPSPTNWYADCGMSYTYYESTTVYWGDNHLIWPNRDWFKLTAGKMYLYITSASGWCYARATSAVGDRINFTRLEYSLTDPPPAYEVCNCGYVYVPAVLFTNIIQPVPGSNYADWQATLFDSNEHYPGLRGWAYKLPYSAKSIGVVATWWPFMVCGDYWPLQRHPTYGMHAGPVNKPRDPSSSHYASHWTMCGDIDCTLTEVYNVVQGLCWSPAEGCFYTEKSIPNYQWLGFGISPNWYSNKWWGTCTIEVLSGTDIYGNPVPTGTYSCNISSYERRPGAGYKWIADNPTKLLGEAVIRPKEAFHPHPVTNLSISAVVTTIRSFHNLSVFDYYDNTYPYNYLFPTQTMFQNELPDWLVPYSWAPGNDKASLRTLICSKGTGVKHGQLSADPPRELFTPIAPIQDGPFDCVPALTYHRPCFTREKHYLAAQPIWEPYTLPNALAGVVVDGDILRSAGPIWRNYEVDFLDTIIVHGAAGPSASSTYRGVATVVEKIDDFRLRVTWIKAVPAYDQSPRQWLLWKCGVTKLGNPGNTQLTPDVTDGCWYKVSQRYGNYNGTGDHVLHTTIPSSFDPPNAIIPHCKLYHFTSYSAYYEGGRTTLMTGAILPDPLPATLPVSLDTLRELDMNGTIAQASQITVKDSGQPRKGGSISYRAKLRTTSPLPQPRTGARPADLDTRDKCFVEWSGYTSEAPGYYEGYRSIESIPPEDWFFPLEMAGQEVTLEIDWYSSPGGGNWSDSYLEVRTYAFDAQIVDGRLITNIPGWTWKDGWHLWITSKNKRYRIKNANGDIDGLANGLYPARLYFLPRAQRVACLNVTLERSEPLVAASSRLTYVNVLLTGYITSLHVPGSTISGTLPWNLRDEDPEKRYISWSGYTLHVCFWGDQTSATTLRKARLAVAVYSGSTLISAETVYAYFAPAEDPNREGIIEGEWSLISIQQTSTCTLKGQGSVEWYSFFTRKYA